MFLQSTLMARWFRSACMTHAAVAAVACLSWLTMLAGFAAAEGSPAKAVPAEFRPLRQLAQTHAQASQAPAQSPTQPPAQTVSRPAASSTSPSPSPSQAKSPQASGAPALSSANEKLPLGAASAAGEGALGQNLRTGSSGAASDGGWMQTLAALSVVLGLLLVLKGAMGKLARQSLPAGSSSVAQVLSRVRIGHRQQLIFIRLGHRVLVLGDSGGTLSTVANLEDADEVATILAASSSKSVGEGFNQYFQRFSSDHREQQLAAQQQAGEATEMVVGKARDEVTGLLTKLRSMQKGLKA